VILLSLLDKLLRLFGVNEQQRRWKEHTRRQQREAGRRARENRDKHMSYRHKTCPECGAVADREARVCAVCGASLPSWRAAQLEKWVGRFSPRKGAMTGALLLANGAWFLMMVVETGSVWGPNGLQSIQFGANYGPLMSGGGEWWRLVVANFVHVGGLIHIAFNLVALAQIGPLVEEFYGTARATVIFLATGVLSAVASHLWHPLAISGGASGAVMGLVGAGVVAGHLQGGALGRAVRNSLVKWVVFIALFGLIVPNIDNAAHFGGLVAGLVLGAGLEQGSKATRASRWVYRGLALALTAVTAVALLLGGLNVANEELTFSERSFDRAVSECEAALEGTDVRAAAEACDRLARLSLFYREAGLSLMVAELWRAAGEPERAERVVAILRASGGRLPRSVVE
jgi:rhomboid protease GluP